MEIKEIKVGIADMNTASSPDKIITIGLGSCVGIALYNRRINAGGLAHIMLPDSTQFSSKKNPMKFADLAVPMLIEKLERLGINKSELKAKIAGGASMFNFSDKSMIMDIGRRNGDAVKNILQKYSIPILAEDLGGNKGRTMIFDTSNGVVRIKTVGIGMKEI
ncbi:chemotaxis protein CheD [Clostridium luticellarii]|jgi:chemotaxis protein CheD|uniref:Probable chemoreceptor glutamine deamidase CheD n=1 Tax=Clostridium luticellarii TaxID=1691940 RepID=A0A2T0BMX6_9CLOT|nr:chemotaxis protein CheD [Clostridium luticellarii]MCI1943976.1 chemotaxis protein CheD [Clostridium luticellarii]MCI1967382.1 chemotaxis protein CheD [Clostridium luticellarii]MCI1996107.1 chemotaxis protein CheD [Clostridium luticellarii]MCI2041256.1 chemotaxis protein CheD [Clostridium luticellarii]PRR85227.1 Chemoreceptor glutamine deamidase CheD [Clostridium luticellarii]